MEKIEVIETHTVTVNYSRSLKEIFRSGKFVKHEAGITDSNFPSKETGSRTIQIEIACFKGISEQARSPYYPDGYYSSESVLMEMEKQKIRPVTIKEVMALIENNPHLLERFVICALGSFSRERSTWDGSRYFVLFRKEEKVLALLTQERVSHYFTEKPYYKYRSDSDFVAFPFVREPLNRKLTCW